MNETRGPRDNEHGRPTGAISLSPDLPSPPPSQDVLAFQRWVLRFWRRSKGAGAPAGPRCASGDSGGKSVATVAVALGTDFAMLAAKAAAALITGSVALLAETLHSLADTSNQLLLMKGLRRAQAKPDLRHPFGYGSEVFYWSLLAALGIFLFGGMLSIWEGIHRLLNLGELKASFLGFGVLALGCLLDGTSWIASVRQLRREATVRGVSFRWHVRSTTDTAVVAVYFEDSAALLGNLIAAAGLAIHAATGSGVPDAVAGIAIGLLLSVVGWRLARRSRDLLTNRSDSPTVLDRIRDLLGSSPEIAAVGTVACIYTGPHRLLVVAEVQARDGTDGPGLAQTLAGLRARIVQTIPRAAAVFLMPVPAVEAQPDPTPWDRDYWLRLFPDHEQE